MSVLHTKYNSGDQIKKTEMGGACNTNGGERERCIQGCSEETLGKGRIIVKWILDKWDGSMDWIDVAQDMDR